MTTAARDQFFLVTGTFRGNWIRYRVRTREQKKKSARCLDAGAGPPTSGRPAGTTAAMSGDLVGTYALPLRWPSSQVSHRPPGAVVPFTSVRLRTSPNRAYPEISVRALALVRNECPWYRARRAGSTAGSPRRSVPWVPAPQRIPSVRAGRETSEDGTPPLVVRPRPSPG